MKRGGGIRSGHHRYIWIVLAALVGAHVVWQVWLVTAAPYPLRYDYDEGVYAETAVAAARGAPLYSSVFLSQPPLLEAVLSRAMATFGASLVVGRTVIIAFSVLWLASIAAIAASAAGPRAGAWAAAAAVSAGAFVTAAHTVQMEGPSEALAALAVALALAAGRRSRDVPASGAKEPRPAPAGILCAAAGAAAGLATMTKFTALSGFVPLGIALTAVPAGGIGPVARSAGRDARRTGRGRSLFLAAITAGAAVAATLAWTNSAPAQFWAQAVAFHTTAARLIPPDPLRTAALMLQFAVSNWFLVAAGLTGAVLCVSADSFAGRAVAAWLAADAVGIFALRPAWPHHLEILVSPLAVLGGIAVERLMRRGGAIPGLSAVIAAGWIIAAVATAAADRPAASPELAAAVTRVQRAVGPDARIVTDDPVFAVLANREVPPALADTSEVRMETGGLPDRTLLAAIHDPRVRAVVLWRGTFRRLRPAFVAAAIRTFPTRWTIAGDRTILLR